MPNRILHESTCTSETIAQLTAEEERLFHRLIVVADDHGRFDGRLAVIRARCFPLLLDTVTEKHVKVWLDGLERADLIRRYLVDDAPYLLLVTWSKHQRLRVTRAKYPEPVESAAVGGDPPQPAATGGDLPPVAKVSHVSGVILPPESESESESESERRSSSPDGDFDLLWAPWPKKVGKAEAKAAYVSMRKRKELPTTPALLLAIEQYVHGTNPRFVMDFARWIRRRRWEDEMSLAPGPPGRANGGYQTAEELAAERSAEWERAQEKDRVLRGENPRTAG